VRAVLVFDRNDLHGSSDSDVDGAASLAATTSPAAAAKQPHRDVTETRRAHGGQRTSPHRRHFALQPK
jgi:hypothetical protein